MSVVFFLRFTNFELRVWCRDISVVVVVVVVLETRKDERREDLPVYVVCGPHQLLP